MLNMEQHAIDIRICLVVSVALTLLTIGLTAYAVYAVIFWEGSIPYVVPAGLLFWVAATAFLWWRHSAAVKAAKEQRRLK